MSTGCSRLYELCSILCCSQTPCLEPGACIDVLLMTHDTTECVLLQLSALRCVFSYTLPPSPPSSHPPLVNVTNTSRDTHTSDGITILTPQPATQQSDQQTHFGTFSQKLINCLLQHLPSLYDFLSGHLESTDQYICFCSSKVLVSVLMYTGVKADLITDVFTKLQSQIFTHVGVYCLQTIRELLKLLRKRLRTADMPREQLLLSTQACLHSISDNHHWLSTLELSLHSDISSASRRWKLEPTVGEFFSLTVEIFRHKDQFSSNSTPELMRCIISNLLRLLSLIKECENLFIFKRFVDVALKVEKEACSVELLHNVIPSLKALLRLPICKEVLKYWLKEYGMKLLPVSVISPEACVARIKKSCLGHGYSVGQNGLVGISFRKTVLFSIKCIARLLSQEQLQSTPGPAADNLLPSHSLLKGVLAALCELLSSVGLGSSTGGGAIQQYTGVLYQVVTEEDGCLVQTLQATTSILRHTIGRSISDAIPGLKTFLAITNPHSLWLRFFLCINFDHSVLLDLLLSPEIDFTTVLQGYLELAMSDWKNFEKTCKDSCQYTSSQHSSPLDHSVLSSTVSVLPSCRQDHRTTDNASITDQLSVQLLSPKRPRYRDHQPNTDCTTTVLVDYSSSSSSEDGERELSEHVKPCNDQADKIVSLSQSPAPSKQRNHSNEVVSRTCESSVSVSTLSKPLNTYELVPSNEQDASNSTVEMPPASSELLGEVMGCLIRLRMALERLGESGLLPVHATSSKVITAIENAEELYENTDYTVS